MMTKKTTKAYNAMVEVLERNRKSTMTGVGPRDSDNELIIQILQLHMGMDLSPEQMGILRSFNMESIRRSRQKLQSAGQYPPDSPEVAKKRRLKSYELEQTAPSESAAGIQRRIAETNW